MTGDAWVVVDVTDPLFWAVLGTEIAVILLLVGWRNR